MQIEFFVALTSAALVIAQSAPVNIKSRVVPACLGAPEPDAGGPVVAMACGPGPTVWLNQQGSAPQLIRPVTNPNLCVTARGTVPGPLMIAPCSTSSLQRFSFNINGTITGQNNLCVTLPPSTGQVSVLPCNGAPAQTWTVVED